MQIGLLLPVLSRPSLHSASRPQGLGLHRDPEAEPDPDPAILEAEPDPLTQVPPVLGSPTVPGGQEHSALCCTPRQSAVGLQQGPPPQNVGPQGSDRQNEGDWLEVKVVTNAGGVVAGPTVRAHLVPERDAVPPHTARHPIAPVSLLTQADWPVLPCQVVSAGLAVGVGTAGVGRAEVLWCKGAAGDEGVSCRRYQPSIGSGAGQSHLCESLDRSRWPCTL